MQLRKEHVVLLGTIAVLGLMYTTRAKSAAPLRSGDKSGAPVEFEHHVAPDTTLSLPEKRDLASFDRDVFAPPRDTHPLPPLELQTPPLPRMNGLRPPPEPAFDAKLFGKFLRAEALPTPAPGLFVTAGEGGADPAALANLSGENSAAANAAAGAATDKAAIIETAEERAARIEGYKKLYDWIRLGENEPMFGQLRNPDRFGIRSRANEALLFVEVKPDDGGAERFAGQKPVPYERARVTEFAFADTPSNRIQLTRRSFAGDIGPSRHAALLAFAEQCVAQRLEAREALTVAEEMYRLAIKIDADDPTPHLGLARCYEAGFEFEGAYEVYVGTDGAGGLLARYPHRPEVHVRLGELEARLRLFESAEQHFRDAEANGGRGAWFVQWPYGRFLLDAGRFDEALAHLREAFKNEPSEPQDARKRAAIRTDLGAALLATGAVDEAYLSYDKALQADPSEQRAAAGKRAAARLGAKGAAVADNAAGQDAGFELLVATALGELEAKNWVAARDGLLRASGADPLRAARALRALSWLAEITGYPEDALRYVEEAADGDPTDAWTLYQYGRLLAQRDDVQGAKEKLVAALDRELDFADALVALGELSYRTGAHAAAERYLERALSIDTARAEVHALRGVNFIELGDLAAARDAFDAALAREPSQALARCGQAWVTYRSGDSDKAITQFAELNDDRRSKPESDEYRVFARGQMERIREHESKVVWTDAFERLQLKNGWEPDEAAGPVASVVDGALHIDGTFQQNGTTRVLQTYAAAEFVAVEFDITVPADCNAKVGLVVTKERRTGTTTQVQSKFGIARRRDGALVVLRMDQPTAEENWEDVEALGTRSWWAAGQTVRLRFEKLGEGNDALGRISIDGITVREGFKLPKLAASTSDIKLGVFVEGQTGLPAKVIVDNVEVIKRIRK